MIFEEFLLLQINNLANFNASNSGEFQLNMNFLVFFIEAIKGRNKQGAEI